MGFYGTVDKKVIGLVNKIFIRPIIKSYPKKNPMEKAF